MSTEVRILDVDDMSPLQWYEFSEARGWGDGLPTLVPTVGEVDQFLSTAGHFGDMPGPIPPRLVVAELRSLAANALMAGCTSAALPIVIAALRAVLVDDFNAVGVMATTHPCTPLVLVSGTARGLGAVNSGGNCLGQGSRGNATIGRALHLMLVNLGGSAPGILDRATHGSPAKYSYCFAEDEETSPWAPYSVRRGYDRDQPVVTVFAAEAPHNINDHGSSCGDDLLHTIASTMATAGSNNFYLDGEHLLVLGPEHAGTLARDGWTTSGIQERLFELAMVPAATVSRGKRIDVAGRIAEPLDGPYRLRGGPDSIQIVVAGGRGKHSVWIPTFGVSRCVSAVVEGVGNH